jgi:hypothetical protein
VPHGAQEFLNDASAALVAEVLHRFGEARLRVTGGSMYPIVRSGDTITVRYCHAGDLHDGDIVLLRDGHRLFAHRLLTVRLDAGARLERADENVGRWLTTRGDAHWHRDPVRPASALIGRVVSLTRDGALIDEPFHLSWWDRTRGLICSAWIDMRRSLS